MTYIFYTVIYVISKLNDNKNKIYINYELLKDINNSRNNKKAFFKV